jgi:hypothetical protein
LIHLGPYIASGTLVFIASWKCSRSRSSGR